MARPRKKRLLFRYLLRGIAVLATLLLILTGVGYYLAASGQEQVPALVEEAFQEQFGAPVTVGAYRFDYLEHFPFLSLTLEDIQLQGSCDDGTGRSLFYAKAASLQFRPWKLLRRKFEARRLSVDSARLWLYRSPEGQFNAGFLDGRLGEAIADTSAALFPINKISINGLEVEWVDAQLGKRHHFGLSKARLSIRRHDKGLSLSLRGGCYIHGLVFKAANGPFLRQQAGLLEVKAELDKGLRLLPSSLRLGDKLLSFQGYFDRQEQPRMHLEIKCAGLLLGETRQLLADNLQRALEPYTISSPLQFVLSIDGPLAPGQQGIRVDFSARDALVAVNKLRFTEAVFSGNYRNHCDSTAPITPNGDCLDIEFSAARFRGSIPMRLSCHAEGLKAPIVQISGEAEFPLEQLNPYLPAERLRCLEGVAKARFTMQGQSGPALSGLLLDGEARIEGGALEYLPGAVRAEGLDARLLFQGEHLQVEYARMSVNGGPIELKGWVYGFTPFLLNGRDTLLGELDVEARRLDFNGLLQTPAASAGPGPVTGDYRFRFNVSSAEVRYRKLQASDARFRLEVVCPCAEGGACLQVDSLSARIFGQIGLEGALRATHLENPQLEMALRLSAALEHFGAIVPADKIRLGGGQLSMAMQYEGPLDDFFNLSEEALRGRFRGNARLRNASAEYLPRAYTIRRLDGDFHFDGLNLAIDSIALSLNDNMLQGHGQIEGLIPFLFRPGRRLKARVETRAVHLDLNQFPLKNQLSERRSRAGFHPNRLAKALDAALASIEGELRVSADTLHFRNVDFTQAAFSGRILGRCEGQQDESGCVVIDTFSGKLFGTAPIRATVAVQDLDAPFFIADARVSMPLKEMNRMFPPDRFAFYGGLADVAFHYEGRPQGQFDVEHALLKASIQGTARISGAALDYKPRGYRLEDMAAELVFDEQGLTVKKLALLLNGNAVRLHGQFYDFLPFLFLPERELRASLELYSPHFDFGHFKAPQKFLPNLKKGPYHPTPISKLVLAGLDHLDAELEVRLDTVSYRHFRASDMSGVFRMAPGLLGIRDASMALAGGQFRLDGQISGLEENAPDIDLRAGFRGADIQQAFRAFDNFGQQGLVAGNIEGRLTAEATFRARANANYDILPESMEGLIGLKVEDGALISLPALDSVQNFLLRKRKLSHIRFATLENTFRLQGRDLFIDHFFVYSTALTFGVEGRYGLGEHPTNLIFELPVGNLFSPGLKPEALHKAGARGKGPALLIRAREDESGKLNFRLVLSRKE
ncbi:MAG: hypothetical protein KDC66_18950 [Phaeodactylibacter sp.]|nr:hypothetical protein [Phaeodactylibacter sp.]